MTRAFGQRRFVSIFGAVFPAMVVWIAAAIVTSSVMLAVLARGGGRGLLDKAALMPALVLGGELWRLLTWCFVELDPLGLIFSVLILVFLGRDLHQAWGPARFLGVYAGLGIVAALVTCLVALVWRELQTTGYLTTWPVVEGLTVAWASLFPSRQILLYFVLPVSGRTLVAIMLAGTAIFALLSGITHFVPHFAAMGAAMLYVRGVNNLLVRWRTSRLLKSQRRPKHLRVVPKKKGNGRPDWLH